MGNDRNLTDQLFETHSFHFFVIAALSFVLLFAKLNQGDLSGYDDALYAHEGKQMLLTGDWWNIRCNGQTNFQNPPLFIWLEAISMTVFGISDFAAKFPSALLGLGTILLVYFIARELTDRSWLPILAMSILMCSQYFMKYATHAMMDVPFTFFFTLAIFFYVKGLKRPVYLLLCGPSIGLGILTRSVIGIIPLGIIVAHLMVNGRYRMLWSVYLIGCFLLALFLPFIWYTSQYRSYGNPFLSAHFSFIMSKVSSGKAQNTWPYMYNGLKYPLLLLELYWPWLPLMVVGFWMQAQLMCRSKDLLASLLVSWVILVVFPLSLAEGKVLRYILPAFPAFSILSAIPLVKWISMDRKLKVFKVIYLVFCILALITAAFPIRFYQLRAQDMRLLAPIAERSTSPNERVLIYTYGETRWDYSNQFIWYANRYCELLADMSELKQRLQAGKNKVAIMDKASYARFASDLGRANEILGESENFICFSTSQTLNLTP